MRIAIASFAVAFVVALIVLASTASYEDSVDPDLGVAVSTLDLGDRALYSAPLAAMMAAATASVAAAIRAFRRKAGLARSVGPEARHSE